MVYWRWRESADNKHVCRVFCMIFLKRKQNSGKIESNLRVQVLQVKNSIGWINLKFQYYDQWTEKKYQTKLLCIAYIFCDPSVQKKWNWMKTERKELFWIQCFFFSSRVHFFFLRFFPLSSFAKWLRALLSECIAAVFIYESVVVYCTQVCARSSMLKHPSCCW